MLTPDPNEHRQPVKTDQTSPEVIAFANCLRRLFRHPSADQSGASSDGTSSHDTNLETQGDNTNTLSGATFTPSEPDK